MVKMNRLAVMAAFAVVAGSQAQVITQNTTQNIVPGSVSCNAGGLHTDNTYARGFILSEHAIAGPWAVTNVEFAVEQATGATGTQPIEVRIYDGFTVAGSVLTQGALLDTVSTTVADGAQFFKSVAVSGIVTSGRLGVEVFTPEGQTAGNSFFIGSNPDGQTHASYLMAAACGVNVLTDTAAIGFPNMHIVMNVTGTPVPEPATMIALATGAVALLRRRRSSK